MATRYNPTPDLVNVPAGPDEIETIVAEDGKSLSDRRKIVHFLKRVHLHMKTQQQTLNKFHTDLAEIQRQAAANRGVSGNLDPRKAAAFLPPHELVTLAKPHLGAMVDQVNQVRADSEREHRALLTRVNRLHLVIEGLLERTNLDPEARRQLQNALTALPEPGEAPDTAPLPHPDTPPAHHPPEPSPPTHTTSRDDKTGHPNHPAPPERQETGSKPQSRPNSGLDGLFG